MANQVRLRVNMIIGGKFVVRGTVLDLELIPERLRNPEDIDRDLEARHGQVLLLRDLNFSTIPRPDSDGVPVSFPIRVTAGQLVDLERVPESTRRSLKEGEDFRSAWTHQELEDLQKEQADIYQQQLEAEPVIQNR